MTFDPILWETINATERAVSRLLEQFRKSPVLVNILAAYTDEIQELMEATKGVIEQRAPGDAVGVQLDGLGRIVGQPRYLGAFLSDSWFVPDSSLSGADYGEAWVEGVEYLSNPELDDDDFTFAIEGKVSRNFTKYGSVPEVQAAIKLAFDIDISFVVQDSMSVLAIVPDDTPLYLLELLSTSKDTPYEDSVYFMGIPMTGSISNVILFSDYTP